MIINSKDSFFSFVDAAEFPEITLLQLRRAIASPATAGDAAAAYMICCCKSSGYGACVVVFNDYVRYIERLNFFACQHTREYSTVVVGLSSSGAAAVAFLWLANPS